ncbi:MAG TPA: hypothetical protein PLJ27_14745, partial [Polyangiaceae bacterium]|nr:hypothetical protein [Polyangiaceae bacterium]
LISAVSAGIIGWLPLALTGLHTQRSRLFGRFLFIALPPYTLYLLKIGGDFMLGRLLVPWLPLFAISADFAARYLFAKQRRLCATIGLTLAATSALPLRILHPAEKFFHIADERTFYPVETIHPLRIDSPYSTWADQLISTFGEGSHGPLTAIGSIGIVAFQTRYPMLDVFGLTDIEIARQPIVQRGRPGHEKLASPSLLLDRGVLLTDRNVFPPEYASWTEVYPGFIPLHSLAYRTDLVTAIRKTTNSSFTDVPSRIERYEPPADDPYRVACDLWFFETYYFAHQSPQARRQFIHRLLKNGKLSPNTAAFFELSDHDEPRGWSRSLTIDFAQVDKRSWLRSGTAFDAFPTDGPILGQTRVSGHSGPLVNSFTSAQGDGALGMLQSPSFRLDGEVITLRVGGGKDATRLRAVLVVDGDEVMTATGCDSEILGRRVWDIAKFRGKSARLVVEDRSADGWGHILLDEFALWRSGS